MALPNLTSLKHKLAAVTAFTFVLLLVQAVLMSGKIDRIVDNGELIKDRTSVVIAKSFELKLHVVQVQQWLTDISATRGLDGLNDGFDQAAEHAKRCGLREISRDGYHGMKQVQFDTFEDLGFNLEFVEYAPHFHDELERIKAQCREGETVDGLRYVDL